MNDRPKPGPAPREDRESIRPNVLSFAVSDSDAAALEVLRKSYPIAPKRSTFLAHIIHSWIEQNRRKDVPCVARNWNVES